MARLSALVCVQNQDAQLSDCLRKLSFCDEVVVVADRCTDRSQDIARRQGAILIDGIFPLESQRKAAGEACSEAVDREEALPPEKRVLLAGVDPQKAPDEAALRALIGRWSARMLSQPQASADFRAGRHPTPVGYPKSLYNDCTTKSGVYRSRSSRLVAVNAAASSTTSQPLACAAAIHSSGCCTPEKFDCAGYENRW